MKVLVTGHNGFIGRNMIAWLASEEWDVEGWTWKSGTFPDVSQYQWVIHLGGISNPNETDVDKILKQNLEFSQRLFLACQEHEVNLQYASSYEVYGKSKDYSESAPCQPSNPYAWSKYLFDRWVFQQPNHLAFVQGFRYFNVYGKYMHLSKHPNVIAQWKKEARKDGRILVHDNAEHVKRDWVWVGDVCRLHIDFIQQVKGSGIWNVGSGLSHSDLDIAEEIAEQEQVPIELIEGNQSTSYKVTASLTNLKSTIGKRKWLNVFEYLDQ